MEAKFSSSMRRHHAVCLPMATQGHINPFLMLAKLLHSHGFYITFVYTEFDYARLLKNNISLHDGHDGIQFATIPDGLPTSDLDANRDIPSLCKSFSENCLLPFKNLLQKINNDRLLPGKSEKVPPVSLVVWDGIMSFGRMAAVELGIPDAMFWTASVCGLVGYLQYPELINRAITPLKDQSFLSNDFLSTKVDWMIPGMNNICYKDLPMFFRTTNPDDIMFNFLLNETQACLKSSIIIVNTLEQLEHQVLAAIRPTLPPTYTIGPIHLLNKHLPETIPMPKDTRIADPRCMNWLSQREPSSVIYVNFGSIVSLPIQKVLELARGLAKSKYFMLWILRNDLVSGTKSILPEDFITETEGRILVANWCDQQEVLSDPSVGAYLTHCGWNSTLEAICAGVPTICWPLFGEQTTNCYFSSDVWGIGIQLSEDVTSDEVVEKINEVMKGQKGIEMRKKVRDWKELAHKATEVGVGSSYLNIKILLDRLTKQS